jgi:hypothetical protein
MEYVFLLNKTALLVIGVLGELAVKLAVVAHNHAPAL